MGNSASRNETRNARSSRKQLAKNSSGAALDCESATRGEVDKQATTHYQVSNSAGLTAAGRGPVEVEQQSYQQQQQRSRQQSNWSLGSLSGRLNWSFTGATKSSFRNRNKTSIRKSFNLLQQKRSKTTWHRPLTNAIFSSHFKETSRNEHFHIDSLIAKGAFGVVFKVIDKQQQKEQRQLEHSRLHNINDNAYNNSEHLVYALKVLKKSKIIEDNSVQQIKDEADIQKLCGHHPFIVRQFDLWQNRRNLHILSEYVPNGELFSKIVSFSIDLIRLYIAEIALAIDFLHNAGIIYRDAKPENILLNETYHIKLTDFGLSKWLKLGSTTKTMCGTFQYMAPEILRGEPYGHAVDWWSLGIITCQMFTDRSPDVKHFLNATFAPHETNFEHPDVTTKSMQSMPSLPLMSSSAKSPSFLPSEVEPLPHAAKDVIKRLLEIDPKQRLRSVLALQRIALYQNYKIDSKHLLSIAPLDIISKDNIRISNQNLYYNDEASVKAIKDFQNF